MPRVPSCGSTWCGNTHVFPLCPNLDLIGENPTQERAIMAGEDRPKPLIVIINISGQHGESVARTFLHQRWRVRAVTEIENEAEVEEKWRGYGVEVVRTHTRDIAPLKEAFKGAKIIFCASDYWLWLGDSSVNTLATLIKQDPRNTAFNLEVQQGEHIVKAAAETTGLERLVLCIYPGPRRQSSGVITEAYHWDAKSQTALHAARVPALAGKLSIVQVGLHMDECWDVMRSNRDRTYTLFGTVSGRVACPWTHSTIGQSIYRLTCRLPNKPYVALHSDTFSPNEICNLFTEKIGYTMTYHQITPAQMGILLPEKAHFYATQWAFIEHYPYYAPNTMWETPTSIRIKHKNDDGSPIDIAPPNFESYLHGLAEGIRQRDEKVIQRFRDIPHNPFDPAVFLQGQPPMMPQPPTIGQPHMSGGSGSSSNTNAMPPTSSAPTPSITAVSSGTLPTVQAVQPAAPMTPVTPAQHFVAPVAPMLHTAQRSSSSNIQVYQDPLSPPQNGQSSASASANFQIYEDPTTPQNRGASEALQTPVSDNGQANGNTHMSGALQTPVSDNGRPDGDTHMSGALQTPTSDNGQLAGDFHIHEDGSGDVDMTGSS